MRCKAYSPGDFSGHGGIVPIAHMPGDLPPTLPVPKLEELKQSSAEVARRGEELCIADAARPVAVPDALNHAMANAGNGGE